MDHFFFLSNGFTQITLKYQRNNSVFKYAYNLTNITPHVYPPKLRYYVATLSNQANFATSRFLQSFFFEFVLFDSLIGLLQKHLLSITSYCIHNAHFLAHIDQAFNHVSISHILIFSVNTFPPTQFKYACFTSPHFVSLLISF